MKNNDESRLDVKQFKLPIRSTDYFPDFFKGHLNKYIEYLAAYQSELKISGITMRDVTIMSSELGLCIDDYYEGKISDSHQHFEKAMAYFDAQLFSHFAEKELVVDGTMPLFRCRRIKEDFADKFELFHLPMERRDICGNSRFGIAGFPCLYLSTSVVLCLKELRAKADPNREKETAYSQMFVSCFKFTPVQSIKVIDFTLSWQEAMVEARTNPGYYFLYPMMFACSIRRAKDGMAFVPEYIVPQMFLQYLIKKNANQTKVIGLRYLPCYSDNTLRDIGNQYNYVFPIDSKTARKSAGYSERLMSVFRWTYPSKVSNYPTFAEAEQRLTQG